MCQRQEVPFVTVYLYMMATNALPKRKKKNKRFFFLAGLLGDDMNETLENPAPRRACVLVKYREYTTHIKGERWSNYHLSIIICQ